MLNGCLNQLGAGWKCLVRKGVTWLESPSPESCILFLLTGVGPASVMVGNLVAGKRIAQAAGRDLGQIEENDLVRKVSVPKVLNFYTQIKDRTCASGERREMCCPALSELLTLLIFFCFLTSAPISGRDFAVASPSNS